MLSFLLLVSDVFPILCLSRFKTGSYVKKERCLQDLNLRGETPLDFKSNALTTRPKQLANLTDFTKYESIFITQERS